MTPFEKSYYVLPEGTGTPQSLIDLKEDKISIYEIPVEFRGMRQYTTALDNIKKIKDDAERKIEKESVRIQILTDIAECKRMHKKEQASELFGVYEEYFNSGSGDMFTAFSAEVNARKYKERWGVANEDE